MGSCCSIFTSSRDAGSRCSMCFAIHTNLKILPCQHAFCRQCLNQLAQSQRENSFIICPRCRTAEENRSPPEHPQTAEESMSLDTVTLHRLRTCDARKGDGRQVSEPPRPRRYDFAASYVAPKIRKSDQFSGFVSDDARYVAVAVNRAGEVAVTDAQNRRVQIFREDGQYLRQLEHREWRRPRGLAYNKVGNLFVADEAGDISMFTATGRWIRTLGANVLTSPRAISVTSDNNVVVCDQGFIGDQAVYLFSPEGETLFHFSTGGELGSEIQSAIFCDEKYFVSVDIHIIKAFDSGGIHLYSFGEYGNRPGEFYCPRGLAAEAENVLFICDSMNNRVQVTSLGGELITSIGMRKSPQCIAVSREGYVFVVTDESNEIQVFKPDYEVAPARHDSVHEI